MLIFAENDQHADLIVRLLREIYEGQAPAAAIRKITGTIENGSQKKIREAVQHFKNEQYPSIVVTVDLLTTGVDVPEITALVFLRRVKSRILFEQMLGRATRLCPAIRKDAFDIYDPIGTYAALEKVSNMKPVAASPKETFGKLLDGLADESLRGMEHDASESGGAPGGENTADTGDSADTSGAPGSRGGADEHGDTQSAAGRTDETDVRQKRLTARLGILTGRLRRKAKLLTPAQSQDAAAALRLPAPAPAGGTPASALPGATDSAAASPPYSPMLSEVRNSVPNRLLTTASLYLSVSLRRILLSRRKNTSGSFPKARPLSLSLIPI